MITTYPLITTIAASIIYAFIFGYFARMLRLPLILGYLIAGILIGPYTPGFIADLSIAKQLAEIGIILLMFGVGLHFSSEDLIRVHKIAIPGAIFQILIATLIGSIFVVCMNYSLIEGIIFGVAISVASTVVLLIALEKYEILNSEVGKIAIGWLIVEDIAMILMIVLLPMIADFSANKTDLQISAIIIKALILLAKIVVFMSIIVIVARKILPAFLVAVSKTKSRELISLAPIAIAMGFAFISYFLFGASFALGAFFAGFVLNESRIGRKSAYRSLPLRDTFAVLFFISVGMLFDPMIIIKKPIPVFITFLIIIIGKPIAAYIITRLCRQSKTDSLLISVSLAQVGEFSFILAGSALRLGIFSSDLYSLILSGAFLSIAVNPLLFKIVRKC